MNKAVFQGSGVALITPFAQGEVDYEALGRLIDWQIDSGTDALIACGTTGESSTMTEAEDAEVVAFTVRRAAGRLPVVAGVGGNDTATVVRAAGRAKAVGASGLLAVTPYYNKTTQKGLIAHYAAVADVSDLPIILYNIPGRTGLNMTPATYRELANHPNIAGIKEASANIEQIIEMARLVPEKALYSGNDDHILPVLAVGGQGVISTTANVMPRQVHDLCAAWFAGDTAKAREIQFAINPLVKQLFCEVNPIPVKAAMALLGFGNGTVRLPLVQLEAEHHAALEQHMQKIGLIA